LVMEKPERPPASPDGLSAVLISNVAT